MLKNGKQGLFCRLSFTYTIILTGDKLSVQFLTAFGKSVVYCLVV